MEDQQLVIGEMDVLIMGMAMPIRNLPYSEQHLIAVDLIRRLNQNLADKFPFTVRFEILAINDGCIKAKLKVAWVLAGTISAAVIAYPSFKAGAKELWKDSGHVIEYFSEGRSCSARYAGDTFPEGLIGPIEKGTTLYRIVRSIDCGKHSPEMVMYALFKTNPEAFIDGNINLIREGAVLKVPSENKFAMYSEKEAQEMVKSHHESFHNK